MNTGYVLLHQHIKKVQLNMQEIVTKLGYRSIGHDESKYTEAEYALVHNKARLNTTKYMSDAYKKLLEDVRPAIDAHVENNSHHPQYHENGINDMDIIDLLEMLADWKAACEDSVDGSLTQSLDKNVSRFNISEELESLLRRTSQTLGWL